MADQEREKKKAQKAPQKAAKAAPQKAKARGSRASGKAVASTVRKATVEGVRRFNRYTYSEGGERRKRMGKLPLTFGGFIVVCGILILLMVLALDSQSITEDDRQIAIAGLPEALENYRILHISDLHAAEFGSEQAALLRAVSALPYDLMLITGDMVGQSGNAEPFLAFLRGLSRTSNVYFIAGDSDPAPLLDTLREGVGTLDELVLADWILEAVALGAHYLDAPTYVSVGATKLWLSPANQLGVNVKSTLATFARQLEMETDGMLNGIGADYRTLPFTNYRYNAAQKLHAAAAAMSGDDVHISLAHVPPNASFLSVVQDDHTATPNEYLSAPDLILAGHYCGGVIRAPGYGALYIPDAMLPRHGWFPDQSLVRGLRTINNTSLFVSAGLGATDAILFPFRLLNRPEITRITLTGLLPENQLID